MLCMRVSVKRLQMNGRIGFSTESFVFRSTANQKKFNYFQSAKKRRKFVIIINEIYSQYYWFDCSLDVCEWNDKWLKRCCCFLCSIIPRSIKSTMSKRQTDFNGFVPLFRRFLWIVVVQSIAPAAEPQYMTHSQLCLLKFPFKMCLIIHYLPAFLCCCFFEVFFSLNCLLNLSILFFISFTLSIFLGRKKNCLSKFIYLLKIFF